jgi:hypothetical protein
MHPPGNLAFKLFGESGRYYMGMRRMGKELLLALPQQ